MSLRAAPIATEHFKYLSMSVINRFFSFEQSVLVQSNVGKMMAYLWVICNETIDNKVFLQRFIEFGLQHQDLVGAETFLSSNKQ